MLATTHFAMGFAPQLAVQSTASRAGAVSMQVGAARRGLRRRRRRQARACQAEAGDGDAEGG